MSETYEDRATEDYERPVATAPRRAGKTEALRRVQEWYEERRD